VKAIITGIACLASLAVAQNKQAALKTQKDQVSYSIGVNIGQNFRIQGVEIDLNILTRGIKDALANGKLRMTEQEINECMNKYQTELIAKQLENRKRLGGKNQQEGETFLVENKNKEGVTTTATGLQYKVIKMGSGAKPKATDTVEVHYRGTTLDGKEFDSSYKSGQTASYRLDRMIKGWIEGIQLMPVGSKFQFFIPPNLAYGERGAGADIPPSATLIFEVELVSIK
jgi:FKBP-type peptidyl-prolyl cis-trans isomerase